ncbi:hypothetical protein BCV71DRAFT_107168 [Rhizopus microsporus]|uniref:Uncharacterized protein n=1 Tax=Rhizopus microsporus TaxID=58291 RepID=A0A1X0S438_RHIZD|nr:hypothetical protein BCV71DRAFT_107168 [Rhizopus microsporus]
MRSNHFLCITQEEHFPRICSSTLLVSYLVIDSNVSIFFFFFYYTSFFRSLSNCPWLFIHEDHDIFDDNHICSSRSELLSL